MLSINTCHFYLTNETIDIHITFDVYIFTEYITQKNAKNCLKIDQI